MLGLEKFYFKKKGTVPPLVFLPEPVVHSTEWSTGSQLLPWFAPFSRFPAEAGGHTAAWAPGARRLARFGAFSQVSA